MNTCLPHVETCFTKRDQNPPGRDFGPCRPVAQEEPSRRCRGSSNRIAAFWLGIDRDHHIDGDGSDGHHSLPISCTPWRRAWPRWRSPAPYLRLTPLAPRRPATVAARSLASIAAALALGSSAPPTAAHTIPVLRLRWACHLAPEFAAFIVLYGTVGFM